MVSVPFSDTDMVPPFPNVPPLADRAVWVTGLPVTRRVEVGDDRVIVPPLPNIPPLAEMAGCAELLAVMVNGLEGELIVTVPPLPTPTPFALRLVPTDSAVKLKLAPLPLAP